MLVEATENQEESFIAQFFQKEKGKKQLWAGERRWEARPALLQPGQEQIGQQLGCIGRMSHQFGNSFIPYVKRHLRLLSSKRARCLSQVHLFSSLSDTPTQCIFLIPVKLVIDTFQKEIKTSIWIPWQATMVKNKTKQNCKQRWLENTWAVWLK